MRFSIRGNEIEVALPQSLEEVNRRIEDLSSVQQRLEIEIKKFAPKSTARLVKGQAIQEVVTELQILKRWRKNANIRLEKLLSDFDTLGDRDLQTEAGLVKHLYLELRRLNRDRVLSIQPDSKLATVLSAAQLWLRNYYSTSLPSAELVKDVMTREQEHERQHQLRQDQQDLEFQQRELIRWQEHLLQQQRDRQSDSVRQAKERQPQPQVQVQRDRQETQEALSLLSQLAKKQK